MNDEEYFLLYEKYLRGACSADEWQRLRTAPQATASLPEWTEAMAASAAHDEQTRQAIYNRLMHNVRRATARRPARSVWRVAMTASVALLLLSSYWLLPGLWQRRVQYTTAYGQQRIIALPDGSQVTLNANSTLETAPTWGSSQPREVWLKGEAYFNVRHLAGPAVQTIAGAPAAAKFVVHSGAVDVAVLGTKFDVSTRAGDTRVVLTSGKVLVTSRRAPSPQSQLLKPGDLLHYQAQQNTYRRQRVDPALYTAWKEHKFIFSETPLPEIGRLLEETYGYTVILEDKSLIDRKLTGTIDTADPEILLYALTKSFGLRVQKDDRVIHFFAH